MEEDVKEEEEIKKSWYTRIWIIFKKIQLISFPSFINIEKDDEDFIW